MKSYDLLSIFFFIRHFVNCALHDRGTLFFLFVCLNIHTSPNYHLKNGLTFRLPVFKPVGYTNILGGLCCFKVCIFLKVHTDSFIQRQGICYRILYNYVIYKGETV